MTKAILKKRVSRRLLESTIYLAALAAFATLTSLPAAAVTVTYDYHISNFFDGTPNSDPQAVFAKNHAKLHGTPGGWLNTTAPALLSVTVDTTANSLLGIGLSGYSAVFVDTPGENSDPFTDVRVKIYANLSQSASLLEQGSNSETTGEILALAIGDIKNVGTIELTAVDKGGRITAFSEFDLHAKAGGFNNCSICIGATNVDSIVRYIDRPDGTTSPIFSAWFALMGVHQGQSINLGLDINGYLEFLGTRGDKHEIPEPLTAALLGTGLLGLWRRKHASR